MATYLLATNAPANSESLCAYLETRLEADDQVVAVNSQRGGDDSSADSIRLGREALDVVEEMLGDRATVETHQFIRGSDPAEDVLAAADEFDADELVIGVRKRNPTSKVVFGSVAQRILLTSNLPMAVVPQEQV
jgi:nucleotide-binding universal stress UspA family protein